MSELKVESPTKDENQNADTPVSLCCYNVNFKM